MIVVDSSALVAIMLDENDAERCRAVLARAESVSISAATLAEAMIVARRRSLGPQLDYLLQIFRIEVVPFCAASARRAAEAYDVWGKGIHPAGLNLADCFTFQMAKSEGVPLLFVGDDFSQTDVKVAR